MLGGFLNWVIALVSMYVLGYGMCRVLKKLFRVTEKFFTIDICVVMGFMALTVYAQFYSLLGGVQNCALVIIIISTLVTYICFFKEINLTLSNSWKLLSWQKIVIILASIILLLISINVPNHPDDDLYHAGAIRWIEEYGVVPGLANVQFRYGYNSSFMCFQALFSFSGIGVFGNRSFHGMNALAALLASCYCIFTLNIFSNRKIAKSDLLKIIFLLYILIDNDYLSSTGTDYVTLYMVAYILIKAIEYIEKNISDPFPFSMIAIFGLFACTLKLSAGPIAIVVLYPLVKYIKKRKWKEISFFIIWGFLVIAPFIIRNVIISGYLLYPFASLDLFDVDWKIPSTIVNIDSFAMRFIAKSLHLREGFSIYDIDSIPVSEWFPFWFGHSLNFSEQILFICSAFGLVTSVTRIATKLIKKSSNGIDFYFLTSGILFLFWLFVCPLPRYGMFYMMIVSAMSITYWNQGMYKGLFAIASISCLLQLSSFVSNYHITDIDFLSPAEYKITEEVYSYNTDIIDKNGDPVVFYVDVGRSRIDYAHFPMTNNEFSTNEYAEIGFRGNNLKDGFYKITNQE